MAKVHLRETKSWQHLTTNIFIDIVMQRENAANIFEFTQQIFAYIQVQEYINSFFLLLLSRVPTTWYSH